MARSKKKLEKCPRCERDTGQTIQCPECGTWCCIEECIAGVGVMCQKCEKDADDAIGPEEEDDSPPEGEKEFA